MKLPTETKYLPVGTFNTFAITGVSMVWGHMLGLLNPWFLPLTILILLAGYGSEIRRPDNDIK